MAGQLAATLRQQALTALFKQPAQLWLAAHTGPPGPDGTAYEVSGNGYGRRILTPEVWGEATVGEDGAVTLANAATIACPEATGEGWGTITAVSVWTAEQGGAYRWHGLLEEQVLIKAGDRLELAPGDVTVRWPGEVVARAA